MDLTKFIELVARDLMDFSRMERSQLSWMKRETSENLHKETSTGACSVAIGTTYALNLAGAAPAENTHEGIPALNHP